MNFAEQAVELLDNLYGSTWPGSVDMLSDLEGLYSHGRIGFEVWLLAGELCRDNLPALEKKPDWE